MKIIDISWPLNKATTGYKDNNVLRFEPTKSFEKDGVRETRITLSSHSGTHVDAPSHFLRDGMTIDELPPDRFVGPCIVLDMTLVLEKINREDLMPYGKDIAAGSIVLLKTKNSATPPEGKFTPHFIYLGVSGTEFLKEKKVKAVGIDYLGIEHSQPGHETHLECMHNDIGIIEGLRLQDVKPGCYFLCCLPLLTIGLDGAPARAILIENLQGKINK